MAGRNLALALTLTLALRLTLSLALTPMLPLTFEQARWRDSPRLGASLR